MQQFGKILKNYQTENVANKAVNLLQNVHEKKMKTQ